MNNFDEFENQKGGFEGLEEADVDWFTRLLLRFWPKLAMKRLAKKIGVSNPLFGEAHNLFSKVERVDIVPLKSGQRGFMLILDGKTASCTFIRTAIILRTTAMKWANTKKAKLPYLTV